ncbi:MAG: hypothetical protein A2Z18_01035 [Armatimonadetes bacterium RBG_16_58_9]|nr:MAG: hypothetical protein A2Z18_01035 [Armatimonadetes bacterium RBG_16_58_9]
MDEDAVLMERVSRGEDAPFRELFDRHYTRAVNVAYRSLGDADLAEDIAMEAFERIYRSRGSYRPSAKFSTYLYRIVVNLSVNASKRRQAVKMENLDDSRFEGQPRGQPEGSPNDDPARRLERDEVARAVRDAILSLPAGQRTAIILTRYEQMSYASAAEAMKVSVGALESLLHRAKSNLRKALAGLVEPR